LAADFLSAIQFLTRLAMPAQIYDPGSLARSVKFFPVVGLLVGSGGALLQSTLLTHLPRVISAFFVISYFICITGGLHEDGLADAADGFGGGRTREKILVIFRDSRIGSFGGIALILSVVGRILLIASLRPQDVSRYLVAASILCRWTALPLCVFLPSARSEPESQQEGQGARIARQVSLISLVVGTTFAFPAALYLLKDQHGVSALATTIVVACLTGAYYRQRIGGITGDCFGATIQLTEIGVYFCGVWNL
jgi:adenosylcobinamide-GDP ribazoletransferase